MIFQARHALFFPVHDRYCIFTEPPSAKYVPHAVTAKHEVPEQSQWSSSAQIGFTKGIRRGLNHYYQACRGNWHIVCNRPAGGLAIWVQASRLPGAGAAPAPLLPKLVLDGSR
jgi:hypothetical protein